MEFAENLIKITSILISTWERKVCCYGHNLENILQFTEVNRIFTQIHKLEMFRQVCRSL